MKKTVVLFALIVSSVMLANTVNAQAVVTKDRDWGFQGYISYDSHEVTTPDGKFNLRLNFQFDLDNPFIMEAIDAGKPIRDVALAWSPFGLFTVEVIYFPSGRVKINGHLET